MLRFISIAILLFLHGNSFVHAKKGPENVDQKYFASLLQQMRDFHVAKGKEAVIILGNQGVGKSSVATLLAGGHLESVQRGGQYVLVDDKSRIATNAKRKTVIPEIVNSKNSNLLIYDFPGFTIDNRIEDEIATKNFLCGLLDYLESVKFVFVATRESIQNEGGFNLGFEKLITRATALLKSVDKNRNGVSLIVTKVENWVDGDDSWGAYRQHHSDDLAILRESIIDLKSQFQRKMDEDSSFSSNRTFYDEAIKLLNIFSDTQKNKMTIFRKPSGLGTSENVRSLQYDKISIDNLVNQNMEFIHIDQKNAEKCAYSNDPIFVEKLNKFIQDNGRAILINSITSIFNQTNAFYANETKKMSDLKELRDMMQNANDKFNGAYDEEPRKQLQQVFDTVKALEINLPTRILQTIKNDTELLDIMTKANGQNIEFDSDYVEGLMKNFTKHLNESRKWYQFLVDVQQKLNTKEFMAEILEAQLPKYDGKYAETFAGKHTKKMTADEYDLKLWASKNSTEHLVVDSFEYERYLNVLREYFNNKLKFDCTIDELSIKGFNVWSIQNDDWIKSSDSCWNDVDHVETFSLNQQDFHYFIKNITTFLRFYVIAPVLQKNITIQVPNDVTVQLKNITIFDTQNNPIAYLWEDVRNPEYPQFMGAINNYRGFVIENLVNNSRESDLRNMIKTLENDKELKKFQSIFSFIEEIQILERQYKYLKDEVSFGPFYESLIERIEKFSQKEQRLENKKALNYVYAAALSKLHLIKKNKHQIHFKIDHMPPPMPPNGANVSLNSMVRSIVDLSMHFKWELLTVNAFINDELKSMLSLFVEEIDSQIESMLEYDVDIWADESDEFLDEEESSSFGESLSRRRRDHPHHNHRHRRSHYPNFGRDFPYACAHLPGHPVYCPTTPKPTEATTIPTTTPKLIEATTIPTSTQKPFKTTKAPTRPPKPTIPEPRQNSDGKIQPRKNSNDIDTNKLNDEKLLRRLLNGRASLILIERISEIASIYSRIAKETTTVLVSAISISDHLRVDTFVGKSEIKKDCDTIKNISKDLAFDLGVIIKRSDATIIDSLIGNFADLPRPARKLIRDNINAMQDDLQPWDEYRHRLNAITTPLHKKLITIQSENYCLKTLNESVVELNIERIRMTLVDLIGVLREIRITQGKFEAAPDYLQQTINELALDLDRLNNIYERIGAYLTLEELKVSVKYIQSRHFSRIQIQNVSLQKSISALKRMIYSDVLASLIDLHSEIFLFQKQV